MVELQQSAWLMDKATQNLVFCRLSLIALHNYNEDDNKRASSVKSRLSLIALHNHNEDDNKRASSVKSRLV